MKARHSIEGGSGRNLLILVRISNLIPKDLISKAVLRMWPIEVLALKIGGGTPLLGVYVAE